MRKFLLLPAAALLVACSPPATQIVEVNSILPSPAPSAPLTDWTATPNRIPIAFTVPGATLRGFVFRAIADSPQKLRILFFNGNAMAVDDAQVIYRDLAVRGADVAVFDYRGYGFSTGKPDVMDFRRDALALYDNLARSGPVVLYGFSMGTAMAAYGASQRQVAGLILAGTISTAQEEFPVFARAQGISPARVAVMVPSPDAVAAFDGRNLISHSHAPLLMLHGEDDQLVPIEQGREVFKTSPAQVKRFISLPGVTHNETVPSPLALQAVGDFLRMMQKKQ